MSHNTTTIRPALPEDHDDIWRLTTENIAWTQGEMESSRGDFVKDVSEREENRRRFFVAVTADATVVGCGGIREWPAHMWGPSVVGIATVIAVEPDFQSQGVGSSLLEALVDAARQVGFAMLYGAVTESSGKFLAKHGWSIGAEKAGVAWIERERTDSAGGRSADDIVCFLDAAAPIRGRAVDHGHGFNRAGHLILDPLEITDVWYFDPDPRRSEQGIFESFAARIVADHWRIEKLQMSTMLWALQAVADQESPAAARKLANQWMSANPAGKFELPRRLKTPLSADQIFDEIFGRLV